MQSEAIFGTIVADLQKRPFKIKLNENQLNLNQ